MLRRPRAYMAPFAPGLKRLQVLHEVALLLWRQMQAEAAVVVIDHGGERWVAAIVVETPLRVREQTAQRRRPVHVRRRTVGCERVGAYLRGLVQVLAGLAERRRHVAARALPLTIEDRPPAARGRRVEAAFRRTWGGEAELVEVERAERRAD